MINDAETVDEYLLNLNKKYSFIQKAPSIPKEIEKEAEELFGDSLDNNYVREYFGEEHTKYDN